MASPFANLLTRSLAVEPAAVAAGWGLLLLRVAAGSLLFVVHGVHKAVEYVAWLRDGAPWHLLDEVAAMGTPAPVAAAFAATAIQLLCPPFLIAGLLTRVNAVLLCGALAGAVAQNVTAGRDPQLALLYAIAMITLALAGGGRWSLDALWWARRVRSAG